MLAKNLLKQKLAILKNCAKMLLVPSVLVSMFSCQKQIEEPITIQKNSQPVSLASFDAVLSSQNSLYEETFEGNGPFFYEGEIQSGTSYGFSVSTSPVFQGKRAGRFELRDSDPSTSGGTRSEAKYAPLTNSNRWYSYAVYFPSSDYRYDSESEIISQWHQGKGVSPSMSLLTMQDKIYLEIRKDPDEKTQFELGKIVKDKWQTYVFHINHSSGSGGIVEI